MQTFEKIVIVNIYVCECVYVCVCVYVYVYVYVYFVICNVNYVHCFNDVMCYTIFIPTYFDTFFF